MLLTDQDVPDAGLIPGDQFNIPPDPAVRQPRTPVPAEHAVCLPQVGKPFHCVRGAFQPVCGIGFPDVLCRGRKTNNQFIFSGFQIRLDIKEPGAVHIGGAANQDSVEAQGSQGIQPVTAQENVFFGEKFVGNRKTSRVRIIMFH